MAASFLSPILRQPETRWVLENARSGQIVAHHLEAAFESSSRNRGLLGRTSLADGHALVLAPCSSIHTWFMQFAIDILFVDREGRVLKLCRALPPWRLAIAWRAFAVIELAAGALERSGTRVDDSLRLTAQ